MMLNLTKLFVNQSFKANETPLPAPGQLIGEFDSQQGYNMPMEAVVALLVVVFLVSLIGNSLVVLIIMKKRRMQSFTNWLLLNLAVADLSVAIICIPLEIPIEIKKYWIYGKVFCSIFYPIQTSTIYGSVFTLVALSSSRYWAIIHPFRRQPTVRHAKILIVIIWLCSIAFVIPYMTILKYDSNHCYEDWTLTQRRMYTIAMFVFQFILPLFVISIAYIFIIYELCFKKVAQEAMSAVDKNKQKETKKVVKLLVIITITFAVCVLPYHTMGLVNEFGAGDFKYYEDINLASYLLLYINSTLNPIIYNVFNERFRETFKEFYKTIIGYTCRRNQPADNPNFFSSRRPSKLEFTKYWNRFSLARSTSNRTSTSSEDANQNSASFVGSPYLTPQMAYETSVKYVNGSKYSRAAQSESSIHIENV